MIDFVAVLFGSARSFQRTREAFYETLLPEASPFMALLGRDRLPARSTLARDFSALTPEPVEALRTLFLDDLLARPSSRRRGREASLWTLAAQPRLVFDLDGTPEAASPRALPKNPALPSALRRLDEVCAPGYTGRQRGEVVRTPTAV